MALKRIAQHEEVQAQPRGGRMQHGQRVSVGVVDVDEPSEAQADGGALHVQQPVFRVGDPLPAVCSVETVAAVLGMTPSGVHKLRAAGKLRDFLLPALPGDRKARFCGRRLQQWLNWEFQPGRVFGQRRARV